MPDTAVDGPVIVLAHRDAIHGQAVDQRLCLAKGRNRSYRLFTAADAQLTECVTEVAPVEFDDVNDARLTEFLIESFWMMVIEPEAIGQRIHGVSPVH